MADTDQSEAKMTSCNIMGLRLAGEARVCWQPAEHNSDMRDSHVSTIQKQVWGEPAQGNEYQELWLGKNPADRSYWLCLL